MNALEAFVISVFLAGYILGVFSGWLIIGCP
jgi:hypothetical protein